MSESRDGGWLLEFAVTAPVGDVTAVAVGTGFCGAFTTFSSFTVETVQLAEREQSGSAVLCAGGMNVVALAGVLLGGAVGGTL